MFAKLFKISRDRGREEREGGENDGVPSYDTSVQGHTKKGRKGFPAMTKASRDTEARRKGKERKEEERKGSGRVFPATSKRPGTHHGEGCT